MSFDIELFNVASEIRRTELQSDGTLKEFEEIVNEIEYCVFTNPNFLYKKYSFGDLTSLYDSMAMQYFKEPDSRISSLTSRLEGLLKGYAKIDVANLKLRLTTE